MSKHVLVTDDEAHTLLALSLILKKVGFKVTTVGNGEEALDKVLEMASDSDPIDLLVIDLEMPGMNGIEVIEVIERLGLALPIIVISGYEARGLLAEKVGLGGVWFLEKPFEPEEFAQCVRNAIHQGEVNEGARAQEAR